MQSHNHRTWLTCDLIPTHPTPGLPHSHTHTVFLVRRLPGWLAGWLADQLLALWRFCRIFIELLTLQLAPVHFLGNNSNDCCHCCAALAACQCAAMYSAHPYIHPYSSIQMLAQLHVCPHMQHLEQDYQHMAAPQMKPSGGRIVFVALHVLCRYDTPLLPLAWVALHVAAT